MILFRLINNWYKKGILGINRRNLHYIYPFNPRQNYSFADNKLITKNILISQKIPVPKIYAVFSHHFQLNTFEEKLKPFPSIVIKPAKGAFGYGIIILHKEKDNLWYAENENPMSLIDIKHHISSIISGIFSIDGQMDSAIVEEKISPPDWLKKISPCGCADIRIVVYKEIPVMAMLRIPTLSSKGRANLHCGAIGVGIEMDSGKTTKGVYRNKIISIHPDTRVPLSGISIPNWDKVLEIAVKTARAVKLGYIGVDIVLEREKGILVLEVNARPGLSIQIANLTGLIPKLKEIDQTLSNSR